VPAVGLMEMSLRQRGGNGIAVVAIPFLRRDSNYEISSKMNWRWQLESGSDKPCYCRLWRSGSKAELSPRCVESILPNPTAPGRLWQWRYAPI